MKRRIKGMKRNQRPCLDLEDASIWMEQGTEIEDFQDLKEFVESMPEEMIASIEISVRLEHE